MHDVTESRVVVVYKLCALVISSVCSESHPCMYELDKSIFIQTRGVGAGLACCVLK